MDPIEVLLTAVILMALCAPVWLLSAFLIGWRRAEQRRGEAYCYMEQRSRELRQRIYETGL